MPREPRTTACRTVRRGHRLVTTIDSCGRTPRKWQRSSLSMRRPAAARAGHERPADAVKVTLGPKGRNVVLEKKWAPHDHQRRCAPSPRRSSSTTPTRRSAPSWSRRSPRRPTTSPVTARRRPPSSPRRSCVRACLSRAGANPMALKRGIEKAVAAVSDELLAQAKDVETKEQIAATASISAADTQIGEMIAEAMDKVGKEGVITVEESNTFGPSRAHRGHALRQGLHQPLLRHRRRAHGGRPDDDLRLVVNPRSGRSRTCCPCSRRSCSPASRC